MAATAQRRKRTSGEGSVYFDETLNKWVAQVQTGHYANGRRKFKRSFHDLRKEAERAKRAMLNALDQGQKLDRQALNVAAYLDHWLAHVVQPSDLQPKTKEGYAYCVKLLKPLLPAVKLDKLTPEHVERLLTDLGERGGEHGGPLSARTVQYARVTLRRALGRAVKHGTLTRNVATLIDPPKSRRADVQPFTEAQACRLLDAVEGTRWEALYAVAVTLGLREGELLGLAWADVDLGRATVRVRQQLQHLKGQPPMLKVVKTRASRRTLDLPDDLVRRLRDHQDRQRFEREAASDAWRDYGLVFPSTVGTPMIPRNFVRHFKGLLVRAGLPERRPHDLRHTAACLMFARGLRAEEVKDVLGHSSIAITIDTYRHWLPQTGQRAAAAMNDFLTRRGEGVG